MPECQFFTPEVPKHQIPADKRTDSKFCCDDHKDAFHKMIREAGKKALGRVFTLSDTEVIPALFGKKRGMHTGRIECKTYQTILGRLKLGPATTLELHEVSGSMATSTDVSAINKLLLGSGQQILCQYKGKFNGRKVFEYSLVKSA